MSTSTRSLQKNIDFSINDRTNQNNLLQQSNNFQDNSFSDEDSEEYLDDEDDLGYSYDNTNFKKTLGRSMGQKKTQKLIREYQENHPEEGGLKHTGKFLRQNINQKANFWKLEVEQNVLNHESRFRDDEDCLDYTQFKPESEGQLKRDSILLPRINNNQLFQEEEEIRGFNALIKQYEEENNEMEQQQGLENGRYSKYYWKRANLIEYCHLMLTIISMGLVLIYYEIDLDSLATESQIEKLLFLMFFVMIIDVIVIYFRYQTNLDQEIRQLITHHTSTLKSTGRRKYLIIEIIILTLQPYPYINQWTFKTYNYYDEESFDFKYNWLLTLLAMIRIYQCLRVMLKLNKFMTPRGNRLCQMYGCQTSYQYIIRCYFKDMPLEIITVLFIGSTFYFAFSLKVCEGPITKIQASNQMDFSLIENCVWATIITMTTVGYGEYFARTLLGRILTIIIAIWGNIIVSMLVVVLTNLLDIKSAEHKALNIIHRLKARNTLKMKAVWLITALAKFHKIIERRRRAAGVDLDDDYLSQKYVKLKRLTESFNTMNRQLKQMHDKQNLFEEIGRQFEYVQTEIKYLKDSQDSLYEGLQQAYEQHEKKQSKDELDSQENIDLTTRNITSFDNLGDQKEEIKYDDNSINDLRKSKKSSLFQTVGKLSFKLQQNFYNKKRDGFKIQEQNQLNDSKFENEKVNEENEEEEDDDDKNKYQL